MKEKETKNVEVKSVEDNSVNDLGLKVVREELDAKTKSGEQMYAYVLREFVNVKGEKREIRVDFSPKDMGGYDVLSLIFMLGDEANLSIREDSMTDDKTGEVTNFVVYELWNVDDDGIVYTYKVKPSRESDKSKLNLIIAKRKAALAQS